MHVLAAQAERASFGTLLFTPMLSHGSLRCVRTFVDTHFAIHGILAYVCADYEASGKGSLTPCVCVYGVIYPEFKY